MADGYRSGYDCGFEDGKSGAKRNPKPPLIKSVVSGSQYTTTFMNGYNEGYRKGAEASKR